MDRYIRLGFFAYKIMLIGTEGERAIITHRAYPFLHYYGRVSAAFVT